MRNTTKDILHRIGYFFMKCLYYIPRAWILTFLLYFLIYSSIRCILQFTYIDFTIARYIYLPICLVFFLLVSIHFIKSKTKRSKLAFWLKKHSIKLGLFYITTLICLYSISNTTTWTYDNINNILTIEWTMFGLSITIFLVWNIFSKIKANLPTISENADYVQKYNYLRTKGLYRLLTETLFVSMILLTCNLLLIILSSTLVYLVNLADAVFTQNIIRCTFIFSTNTIICLFHNILGPIYYEKRELVKANEVTKEQIDEAKDANNVQIYFDKRIDEIINSSEYSNEEKRLRISIFVQELKKYISEETTTILPAIVDDLVETKIGTLTKEQKQLFVNE